MLVLSRKLGEKVFIGQDITLTVLEIDRGKIRLGIDCPRDVPILREELADVVRAAPTLAQRDAAAKGGAS